MPLSLHESRSPAHGKIRNLRYQNKHLGECLTQFENKICEASKCATTKPLYTSTISQLEQRNTTDRRIPPAEEERELEERAQQANQPAIRSATEPAPIHPNKGQPPHKEASFIATENPPPHSRTTTTEWRNLPSQCGPPAQEQATPPSAAHKRPMPDYSKRAPRITTHVGLFHAGPAAVEEPPDALDGLVQALEADYVSASSWTEFLEKSGTSKAISTPQVKRLPNAASELLEDLRVTGANVKLSTP
jgi:hypothetical protein